MLNFTEKLVNQETGDLNYAGILIKSVIMGVFFYIAKYFSNRI